MINDLLEMYPNSLLNPENQSLGELSNYYHIQEAGNHLYIAKDHLGEKEEKLLTLLSAEKQGVLNHSTTLASLLLEGKIDSSLNAENVQLVYLNIQHLENERYSLWKDTLMDSIEKIIDISFMTEDLIVLLLEADSVKSSLINRLKEVIQTLDQDFNLLTQGMIGQLSPLNSRITEVFDYEKQLFQSFIQQERIEGILSLSDVLMNQQALLLKEEKPVLPSLFNAFTNNPEWRELILALFKSQGNLSQAAEELFIHRNTLTYRINKFNSKTGIDLNYFPDLILSYLLVI